MYFFEFRLQQSMEASSRDPCLTNIPVSDTICNQPTKHLDRCNIWSSSCACWPFILPAVKCQASLHLDLSEALSSAIEAASSSLLPCLFSFTLFCSGKPLAESRKVPFGPLVNQLKLFPIFTTHLGSSSPDKSLTEIRARQNRALRLKLFATCSFRLHQTSILTLVHPPYKKDE